MEFTATIALTKLKKTTSNLKHFLITNFTKPQSYEKNEKHFSSSYLNAVRFLDSEEFAVLLSSESHCSCLCGLLSWGERKGWLMDRV
jgi:hypothetical protein